MQLRSTGEAELSLQKLLEQSLVEHQSGRSEGNFGTSHPVWKTFTKLKKAIESLSVLRSRPSLRVEWSVGKGNWARVPWLAIFSRAPDAPTGGIYCVFIFREDMTGVYLALIQGVTKLKRELGAALARAHLGDHAIRIRAIASDLKRRQFVLDNDIDLRSEGLGETYEESTIAYKFYGTGEVPQDEEIALDLEALLVTYQSALETIRQPSPLGFFKQIPSSTILIKLSSIWTDGVAPFPVIGTGFYQETKYSSWKSGADAGIVAEATVLTPPAMSEETEEERRFVIDAGKFSGPQLRVRLRIGRALARTLTRSELKTDPRLADLSILKFSQGTNFPVTPEQAIVIRELIKRTKAEDDEIPGAGIKCKERTHACGLMPRRPGSVWEEVYRDEIMAIGWDETGRPNRVSGSRKIAKKLIAVSKLEGYPINDSRACEDFVRSKTRRSDHRQEGPRRGSGLRNCHGTV